MSIQSIKQRVSDIFGGGINRRILAYILIVSSLATLIFTAYSLYREYQNDESLVEQEINSIRDAFAPIIAHALWKFDADLVVQVLGSMVAGTQTESAEIRSMRKEVMFKTGALSPSQGKPAVIVDLVHFDSVQGRDNQLGYIYLYGNHSFPQKSLRDRFFRTLYTQTFKTFLTSAFILLIVHRLVSRHLQSISRQLSQSAREGDNIYVGADEEESRGASSMQPPLELARQSRQDEIQTLLDSLNQYRESQQASLAMIIQRNAQLRSEVQSRKQAEEESRRQYFLVERLFDSRSSSVFVLTETGELLRCNRSALTLIGRDKSQVLGKSIDQFIRIQVANTLYQKLSPILLHSGRDQESVKFGYCVLVGAGQGFPAKFTIYPLRLGSGKLAVYALDIEDERSRQKIERLAYVASHDFLTDLLNRHELDKRLGEMIESKKNDVNVPYFTLGFVDLDQFKSINDVFGHVSGDEVLQAIAVIIQKTLVEGTVIGRLGGDEFLFFCDDRLDDVLGVAQNIAKKISAKVFGFDGQTIHITASIGLAEIDARNETVSTAISKADAAAYQSKQEGGGQVVAFDSKRAAKVGGKSDFKLINIINVAIQKKDALIYAQEIVPMQEDSTLPLREELLIRVIHNNRVLLPHRFIDVLSRNRRVHIIDSYMLNELNSLFRARALSGRHLNVNMSPRSFHNLNVKRSLIEALAYCKEFECTLCVEITEDELVHDQDKLRDIVDLIKHHGGLIAVDDFGRGYASYGYIQSLDLDFIKIDGSLVTKIDIDPKVNAIISSIISIADSCGAYTVAERAADRAQMQLLRELGVDYSQCFVESIPKLFESHKHGVGTV